MSRQPLQPALMRNGFTKVVIFILPIHIILICVLLTSFLSCSNRTTSTARSRPAASSIARSRTETTRWPQHQHHAHQDQHHIRQVHHFLDHDHLGQVFKAYLAWCETQRDCNRLRLVDILVRPMQRLTKYSLLLKVLILSSE